MTPSKVRSQVPSPDLDPSIASAQVACHDLEREFIARYPTVAQLIEQERERSVHRALRRHFTELLKSNMPGLPAT